LKQLANCRIVPATASCWTAGTMSLICAQHSPRLLAPSMLCCLQSSAKYVVNFYLLC